ncbi:MAG: aminotransferase class III-fold pyridoxal phosphate-dependent enzyme, partial [Kiritimatiellaeota bacterium]|nr:aminotransferase class III-fold pyridoxal phosphate-dependent enzyme [Kiritimatiellota bacterium]
MINEHEPVLGIHARHVAHSLAKENAALYGRYVMNNYAQSVTLVSGHGTKVRDADNKTYLDFTSGISCLNVGHAHPKVTQAIQGQAAILTHCSNLFFNAQQPLLAEKLSKISLGGKCFFCNSGAEANEAMVKLARLWGHDKGRFEVITMENSFHGR